MRTMPRRIAGSTRLKQSALSGTLTAATIALTLGGCSVMPNNVAAPKIAPATQAEINEGVKVRYLIDEKPVIYGVTFSDAAAIRPIETTFTGVQTQIMALRGTYVERKKHLQTEIDAISNTQFLGVIVAAAGVATKSNAVRNTGAGAAGFSGLWGSHYNLAIQSTNYTVAINAMTCISNAISSAPEGFWKQAYTPDGIFITPKSDFVLSGKNPEETSAAYDALAEMYNRLHKSISSVDEKLRSLQAAVTIAAPSPEDIQNAATNNLAALKKANSAETPELKEAVTEKAGEAKAAAAVAQAEKEQAQKTFDEAQISHEKTVQKLNTWSAEVETAKTDFDLANSDMKVLEVPQKNEVPGKETDADKEKFKADFEAKRIKQLKLQTATIRKNRALSLKDSALKEKEQSDKEILTSRRNLSIATTKAESAQKKAEAAEKLAELVELGVIARAVRVPSNAETCVVAMGK